MVITRSFAIAICYAVINMAAGQVAVPNCVSTQEIVQFVGDSADQRLCMDRVLKVSQLINYNV